MKKMLLAAIAILACAVGLGAEGNKDLLGFYDTELIKVNFQTMGGLTLSFQGQSTATRMGISGKFQDILGEYEDSAELMRKYRTKNMVGNALMFGGMLASLGGAYYPILANDSINGLSYSDFRSGLWLCIAGLAAATAGSFILPSSYQDLLNSVNSYNRSKMTEY
jgi:hypothetical protein